MSTPGIEAPKQTPVTDHATKRHRRTLLVNNLVAALAGLALMILVHELAHLVAGAALGYPSILYAFAVTHLGEGMPLGHHVITMMAGPVFSLVSGVVMQVWTPLRRRANFAHLLWLWFAFLSVQEGIAYLCVTPFGVGDTGQVATALGLPLPVSVAALLVGVAGMFANARSFATHVARHAGQDRRDWMPMAQFPWLYGTIISLMLNVIYILAVPLPTPIGVQVAVLAACTALLVFAPMAFIFAGQVRHVAHEPLQLRPVPVPGIVLWVALVAFNLALSPGWFIIG